MTFPLFLSAFGDGDDAGHVRRFHDRLERDGLDRPRHPPAYVIDGIEVSEVLARLRAGDRGAFRSLYTALFESLWRIAALQTHSAAMAGDVVHDVFLRLWMRRESLPENVDIRVYLSVAVRNRVRDLAKHALIVDSAARAPMAVDAAGLGQPLPATDAAVESDEFLTAYADALALLSEREKTAALLRWEEGFSLEQIAQVLGLSIMGARGVVLRAQRKVQDALQRFR